MASTKGRWEETHFATMIDEWATRWGEFQERYEGFRVPGIKRLFTEVRVDAELRRQHLAAVVSSEGTSYLRLDYKRILLLKREVQDETVPVPTRGHPHWTDPQHGAAQGSATDPTPADGLPYAGDHPSPDWWRRLANVHPDATRADRDADDTTHLGPLDADADQSERGERLEAYVIRAYALAAVAVEAGIPFDVMLFTLERVYTKWKSRK